MSSSGQAVHVSSHDHVRRHATPFTRAPGVPDDQSPAKTPPSHEAETGSGPGGLNETTLAATELEPAMLFPIIRAVARGHSGAAGYSYAAAEPPDATGAGSAAGLRYGLTAARLDTGDLGQLLLLARDRDPELFPDAFGGPQAARALIDVTTAPSPKARLEAVDGEALWSPPWLSRFVAAGEQEFMRAAQNEFAIERQFRPLLASVARPGFPRSATVAALMLDAVVAEGLDRGLQAVRGALDALGLDVLTETMLCDGLAMLIPDARPRLLSLKDDPDLAKSPLFRRAEP